MRAHQGARRPYLGEAQADLLDSLRKGPMTTPQLVRDTGRNPKTVHNAITTLEQRGLVRRLGAGPRPKSGGRESVTWMATAAGFAELALEPLTRMEGS